MKLPQSENGLNSMLNTRNFCIICRKNVNYNKNLFEHVTIKYTRKVLQVEII